MLTLDFFKHSIILRDVPARFNSLETGKPFIHCCSCDCALNEAGAHIVNKSYVGDECVFELAMCIQCREDMNAQLSEESRAALFDFMHDNTDMEAREQALGTDSAPDDYLAHCITCGTSSEEATGYTLGAMFAGDALIKGPFPMLICAFCEEKINSTISDETRETWDRFIGEHFPGPPSELHIPAHKPVLV